MINLKARETRTLVAVHGWAGAVLVSDYGRGLTASPAVRDALSARRGSLVWDPHPRGPAPVAGMPGGVAGGRTVLGGTGTAVANAETTRIATRKS